MSETKYQSDDPRQIDLEEAIAERGGRPYTPGPRQAVATDTVDHSKIKRDYFALKEVLDAAYFQAAYGKGKERHADDKPFTEQPLMQVAAAHGMGFLTGQAEKKLREAVGMVKRNQYEAAQKELLGAIVYISAAHIHAGAKAEMVSYAGRVDLKVAEE